MPKVRSRAQARLFGAIAGGVATKARGLSRTKAKAALRGKKLKGLPARAPSAKKKKGKKKR